MLILGMYPNSRIYIGPDITITALEHDKKTGNFKVGIEAPDDVVVLREKLVHGLSPEEREKAFTPKT